MALGTQSLALYSAAMKEFYLPGLESELYASTVLLDLFSKKGRKSGEFTEKDTDGKYVVKFIKTGRSVGVGARAETARLPAPGYPEFNAAKFKPARLWARGSVYGSVLDNTEAGMDYLAKATADLKEGLKLDINRQLHGDGSGLLATCVSASDSGGKTTITLLTQANAGSASPAVTNSKLWNGVQYLKGWEGRQVHVLLRSTGAVNSVGVAGDEDTSLTIDSVDETNNTVTLSGTVAAAGSITTDYGIYVAGVWTSTAGSGKTTEMYGLGAIIATGNPGFGTDDNGYYGGINRSTVPTWKSNVMSNSGVLRSVSQDLIQQAFDTLDVRIGGKPTVVVGQHAMIRQCANLLLPDRRYVPEPVLEGGWTGFKWNGVPFVPDRDAPPHTLRFIDGEDAELLRERPLDVRDHDGNFLERVANYNRYTFDVYATWQLGSYCPACHLELADLSMSPA